MKRHLLFLTGLVLAAGLSAGCSDSGSSHTEAETAPVLSEKLTPEEEAMIASAEAEEVADPALFETP